MRNVPTACIVCGQPTTGTRCPTHRRPPRPWGAKARRYNANFRRLRAAWAPRVDTGDVLCARCGQPIHGPWDLDHLPTGELHPSHATCNRRAGAKRNNPERGGLGKTWGNPVFPDAPQHPTASPSRAHTMFDP